jgi:hypothetical protein
MPDYFFGRIEEPDERDNQYPMKLLLPGVMPKVKRKKWSIGPVLDQGRTNSCFPAGTLVRMATGEHRPIEELRPLDQVVTAEGNVGRVMQVSVRFHGEGLVRLQLWGHRHLRATPEHPVLTKRGYVPIGSLKPGDYVALTRYMPEPSEKLVTDKYFAAYEKDRTITNGRIAHIGYAGAVTLTEVAPLLSEIPLTVGVGRIFGLFLAEGSAARSGSGRLLFTFSDKERDTLVAETVRLLQDELGIKARLQERPNHSINVVVGGHLWSKLFARLFGTGAANKGLPPEIASGSPEFLAALLSGWLDGDGYHRRSSKQGVTISHRLVMDMHAIAQGLGMRPAIRISLPSPNAYAKTRRPRWDLEMSDNDMDNYRSEQDGKAVWRRVVGLEFEDFAGYVYNCHVEGDESYVAEGIGVHNCVGHGVKAFMMATPVKSTVTQLPSAMDIYELAKRLDDDPTNDNRDAGTSVRAGIQAIQQSGHIKSYVWAQSVDDVARWLLTKGTVVIGTGWTDSMTHPDNNGYINVSGPYLGGHCTLLYGVDMDYKFFWLQNSWSSSWGLNGCCKLTFDDLSKLLSQGGEAVTAVERLVPGVAVR